MQTRWSSAGRTSLWVLGGLAASLRDHGLPVGRRAACEPVSVGGGAWNPQRSAVRADDPTLAEAVGVGAVQLDPATGHVTGDACAQLEP